MRHSVMRPSVQMYALVSEKNEAIMLRDLSLEMPLKCKKAERELTPLCAQALLEVQDEKSQVTVQLDPKTLALTLKGKGSKTYALQRNGESLRLKRHVLQCWIMLLRARQIKLSVDHEDAIAYAKKELKALNSVP